MKGSMKGLIITDIGVEWAAAQEVKEKLGVDAEERKSCVSFEVNDLRELCLLAYSSQSAQRVLLLLGEFEFKDLEELKEKAAASLKDFDFKSWFEKETSFRATCEREGEHSFSSGDAEQALGAVVTELAGKALGNAPDVSLEEPDLVFYAYIHDDNCYLGIDFAGRDLSQRDYKVFMHPTTIRGNIAYSLVRMAGYEKEKTFLDPFCGSAPFPLEAAYHASKVPMHVQSQDFPFVYFLPIKEEDWDEWFRQVNKDAKSDDLEIYAFDKNNRNLKYGKKNAKIALMEKFIKFSKAGVGWLDTKFEEGQVDCIVTQPPQITNNSKDDEVKGAYDELFYQAKYVLSQEGIIVALLLNTKEFLEAAGKHGFEKVDENTIVTGDLEYSAIKLKAKA